MAITNEISEGKIKVFVVCFGHKNIFEETLSSAYPYPHFITEVFFHSGSLKYTLNDSFKPSFRQERKLKQIQFCNICLLLVNCEFMTSQYVERD